MKYSLWGLARALCVLLTAAFVAGCSGQATEQPTPTASGGSQPHPLQTKVAYAEHWASTGVLMFQVESVESAINAREL